MSNAMPYALYWPIGGKTEMEKVAVCIQDPSATVGERHERDCANGEFSVADR